MFPLIYAHRGVPSRHPENTLDSFQAALEHKADGIELDVQLTLDNEVVVIHDHRIERTTSGQGPVQEYTLQELKRFCCTNNHPTSCQHHTHIPSLCEVCEFVEPTTLKLIIELKNLLITQPLLEKQVLDVIHQFQLTDRTIISSFNFESIRKIKQLDPKQKTALLYVGPLQKPWELCKLYQADQLHVPREEITSSLVKQAKKHNLEVTVWTVDSLVQIKRYIQFGVDSIITNYPLQARKLQQE